MRVFLALMTIVIATMIPTYLRAQPQQLNSAAACPIPFGTGQAGFSDGFPSPPEKNRADLIKHFAEASAHDEDVSKFVDRNLVSGADLESCKVAIKKLSALPNCKAVAPYQNPNGKVRLAWDCSGWVDYNMFFVVDDETGKITKVYGSARIPPPALPPERKTKTERG